ncbi:helix-turn-helix transcriptional regulator [Phreatobacter sp.]|uniref:helix-turn-helix transcriptional regulator n=1 Tax=Phreatobacter sp. TaxID=1966341 RepID=UPI003F72DA31
MGRRSAVLAGRAEPPIRFGLCDVEAAASVGVGVSLFRSLVDKGHMPRPRMIGSRRIWDAEEVHAAFKRLPHDGPEILQDDDKWGRVVP